jgi:hypothetical protein
LTPDSIADIAANKNVQANKLHTEFVQEENVAGKGEKVKNLGATARHKQLY